MSVLYYYKPHCRNINCLENISKEFVIGDVLLICVWLPDHSNTVTYNLSAKKEWSIALAGPSDRAV